MADFKVGISVTTTTSSVDVTVNPAAPLASGLHHFQLVVVDDSGNHSEPAVVGVIVKDSIKPTAVITASAPQVDSGQSFKLDGSKSSDVPPGKITQFIWTMID